MSTTTRKGLATATVVAAVDTDTRTATIVVAASNSLDPTLADPLYRCSGVADNVEMNAALVAAAAVNGSVSLLEGTYNTILTLNVAVYVMLKGVGWGSVINFNAGGNAITITGDHVKLRDLRMVIVAGAGAGGSRPNCIIAANRTNVEITKLWLFGDLSEADDGSDARQNGILLDNLTYSKVFDCTISNFERNGIATDGGSHNEVGGNIVRGNLADGIRIEGSDWSTITGNTLEDNTDFGISLTSVDDCTVVGNTCDGQTASGIRLYSSTQCTVTGNTCENNGTQGIELTVTSSNNTITGNTCIGNTQHGIQIASGIDNTVTGNTCQGNTTNGIDLSTDGNTATGNTCQGNNNGIDVNADNCTVTGNTCQGNAVSGISVSDNNCTITGNTCQGNTRYGISLSSSINNTITGNTCYQNVRHGIFLSGVCNVNTIVGNTCNENDVNNTATYDGICIENDCDYNVVHSNTCNDNDRWGISIGVAANDCVENWVKNNQLRGNTSGPFIDNGTNTKLAVKVFQFTEAFGGDAAWQTASPTGILIDGAGDSALAEGEAPLEVQMAVRFRVKGVCLGNTGAGKGMLLEININAGKPTGIEAYNAEAIAVAGVISTEDNVVINAAIEWIIDASDDADIDDIEFGETMEMFAIFEDTGADSDIATNAVIRTISMEFV